MASCSNDASWDWDAHPPCCNNTCGLTFAYDLSPMTRSAQTLPTRLDTEEIQYSVPVGRLQRHACTLQTGGEEHLHRHSITFRLLHFIQSDSCASRFHSISFEFMTGEKKTKWGKKQRCHDGQPYSTDAGPYASPCCTSTPLLSVCEVPWPQTPASKWKKKPSQPPRTNASAAAQTTEATPSQFPRTVRDWNELPPDAVLSPALGTLKSKVSSPSQ